MVNCMILHYFVCYHSVFEAKMPNNLLSILGLVCYKSSGSSFFLWREMLSKVPMTNESFFDTIYKLSDNQILNSKF